jgi:plastocyanin
MRLKHLVLVLGLGAMAACSGSDPYGPGGGGGGGGHTTALTVSNDSFTPTPDTVSAGQVTFTWSNATHGHNVTWDSGPNAQTNTATMTSGTYQPTLITGTYNYHCSVHGAPGTGMHGTIVVQ